MKSLVYCLLYIIYSLSIRCWLFVFDSIILSAWGAIAEVFNYFMKSWEMRFVKGQSSEPSLITYSLSSSFILWTDNIGHGFVQLQIISCHTYFNKKKPFHFFPSHSHYAVFKVNWKKKLKCCHYDIQKRCVWKWICFDMIARSSSLVSH